MKNFINKKIAFISFTTILACTLVFFIAYNIILINSYENYKNYINKIATSINSANNISVKFDAKDTKKQASNSIHYLLNIKKDINHTHVINKYKYIMSSLNAGITENILAYKQLILCIDNPDDPNLSSSINSLDNYQKLCVKKYSETNSFKKDLITTNNFSALLYNSKHYFAEKQALKKYNAVSSSELSEFNSNISTMANEFNSIRTNFKFYAEEARNKKISYNYALKQIEDNQSNLSNFEQNLANLSIPQNKVDVFCALKKSVNDYKLYIKDFISALTYEENSSDTYLSASDISKLYNDSDYKFKKTNEDFDKFNKLYK
ncbi:MULTISPECIES: hypothetical protein [Clostridium]|uniref:hypothetical protein n=1 Tax=Clostridium TaxID=1485 RepID=UPI00082467FC|nr:MULTISPECIES: hypothetical protein [Clostridium]PJI08925.1 hypothetical protein CUB90_14110 [Clostridium sp. CT7]